MMKSQNDIEQAVAYTGFAHLYLHNNETWISSSLPLKNCAVYQIAPHRVTISPMAEPFDTQK